MPFKLYKRKGYAEYYANVRIYPPNGPSDRKQVNTHCTDRRRAEEWARLYEARRYAELVRGEADPPAPTEDAPRTLGDAFALMERHVASRVALYPKKGGLAPGTAAYYALHLGHFARVWGMATPLPTITTGKARAYVEQRLTEPGLREGQHVTLHTITKELGALRIVLRLAHEHGWYPHDPRAIVPTGVTSEYTPRDRTLTPKELDALQKTLAPHRWAVVAFACATGAESSALTRAQRGDVDLKGGFVIVRGSKNEKRANRRVPIVLPLARRLLKAVLQHADGAGEMLFGPWHNRSRDVHLACEAAKLDLCSPNDWRRTFATWHADAGVTLDTLRHAMGHASSKMLEKVYDKPKDQDVAARMRREMKGPRQGPTRAPGRSKPGRKTR